MRYRLPDALGGHPVKLIRRSPNPNEMSHVLVELADESFPLLIHLMVLVVVKPPLPEEPPSGSVAIRRSATLPIHGDLIPLAYLRSTVDGLDAWRCGGARGEAFTWATLNDLPGDFTVFVPDPFAEPVELPWTGRDESGCEVRVGQSALDDKAAYVDAEDAHLSGEDTRAMARALWAAADAAERAS